MRVKSLAQVAPVKVKNVASNVSSAPKKTNLILAQDEFVKPKDGEKASLGALIGVCALGISILYGTFKLTDTMFKRF